ncbi:MAG: FAD-binding oxidoreductase [Spirochaetes bacterium]|nr:FAD-binding oxidoreductase [Spirochaetota bacterium]
MRDRIIKQIEGYEAIERDIVALKKYGYDYRIDRGEVKRIIERLHPSRLVLRVVDIIEETPSTKTFRLVPKEGYLPPFMAGQYISISVEIGNIRTARAYSISSPPHCTGYYDITVRRVHDGFVSHYLLDEVTIGDEVVTSGPCGNFFYNPIVHGRELVFIAGGSGITPFMSMIREIAHRGLNRTVHLFYGNKTDGDIIFHEELVAIAAKNSNIRYYPVVENPSRNWKGFTGYITKELLVENLLSVNNKTFFLCGPQGLYDFIEPQLAQLGIPRKRVRREMYGSPPVVTVLSGWPPEISASHVFNLSVEGKGVYTAKAGENILTALERAGFVLPNLCRSGECSACRTKLISGKVYHHPGAILRKSDRIFNYIHTCAAYPLSDVVISLD